MRSWRAETCRGVEKEMKRRKISRAKLATRMKTNRATLDRLFSDESRLSGYNFWNKPRWLSGEN